MALGGGLLVLALGFYALHRAGAPDGDERAGGEDTDALSSVVAAPGMEEAGEPRMPVEGSQSPAIDEALLGELPSSLRGTTVPDVLRADAAGNLIVTADMPSLFEYFMSAFGEEPPEVIAARIQAEIENQLPPQAAEQALEVATDYSRYRFGSERARTELLQSEGWQNLPMGERLERWQEARANFFQEDVADAFFSEREAAERYAIERATISFDPNLDDAAREAAYEDLFDSLPEGMAEQIQSRSRMSRLHHEVSRLRSEAAPAAAIHQARLDSVGAGLTAQLEALDEQRGIVDP